MRWAKTVILLSMLLWLGGCGSKSSTDSGTDSLPVAVAVAEPSRVEPGRQVTLRGGESRDPKGGALIFHWDQAIINSLPVSFSANDTEASFTVQVTLQETGTYTFTLTVENERGQQSLPDTVKVVVQVQELFKPKMVWIEPGTFMMGSPSLEPGRSEDEGPQHQVTISKGFYLGQYELTQGEWQAVMGTRPWSGKWYVQENPDNPAVYISWDDLQEFIGRLNDAEGEAVYRLPTEAEWEYACRAGTTTRWSFGDGESQLKDYAWYRDNTWEENWELREEYGHRVGTKLPNPWGLYDMHGNVREWCQDWYEEKSYSSDTQTDPVGPGPVPRGGVGFYGSTRVLRGGFYYGIAQTTRSASRDHISPGYRSSDIGARLLRTK